MGSQRLRSQGMPGIYKMNILSGTTWVCFASLPTSYAKQPQKANPALPADSKTTCQKQFLHIFAACFFIKCLKGNISRNMKFANSPDDIGNTEGQYQAGEHRTDLCAGWEGYCQAVSLQLQVEEWYSWCCWGPPGHSSHSQGRTRCLKSWPSPQGQEMHFGEADVFVTGILRSQRCWKTLNLTDRHNHSEGVTRDPSPHQTRRIHEHSLHRLQRQALVHAQLVGVGFSLPSELSIQWYFYNSKDHFPATTPASPQPVNSFIKQNTKCSACIHNAEVLVHKV